jgi:hypothetical protein
MGREKEAQPEAEEVRRLNIKYYMNHLTKLSGNQDHTETDKIIDALGKAGLK